MLYAPCFIYRYVLSFGIQYSSACSGSTSLAVYSFFKVSSSVFINSFNMGSYLPASTTFHHGSQVLGLLGHIFGIKPSSQNGDIVLTDLGRAARRTEATHHTVKGELR